MKQIIYNISIILSVIIFYSCSGQQDSQKNSEGDHRNKVADNIESEEDIDIEESLPEIGVQIEDLSTSERQIEYMQNSGEWEKYESGILPQMAVDAPEYCEKLLKSESKRFIIVDKAKMKLFLYDSLGNVEKKYGIACAKNYGTKQKKGDSRTTEGFFNVKGIFDSTNWLFTDDNGYTSPKKGQYGPRFIRLNIPYIGIHGTGSPGSIGKRCSHGCIRVTNDNILELVNYVDSGMPVIISPGPRDIAVNEREKTRILAVATEPGTSKAVAAVNNSQNKASKTTETTPEITESEIENPEGVQSEEVASKKDSTSEAPEIQETEISNTEKDNSETTGLSSPKIAGSKDNE